MGGLGGCGENGDGHFFVGYFGFERGVYVYEIRIVIEFKWMFGVKGNRRTGEVKYIDNDVTLPRILVHGALRKSIESVPALTHLDRVIGWTDLFGLTECGLRRSWWSEYQIGSLIAA